AASDQLLHLRDVGGEPVKLLADVNLAGNQDCLLMQTIGIKARGGVEEGRDLLGDARLDSFGLPPGRSFRARREHRDLAEPVQQNFFERRPLMAAHGRELSERLLKTSNHGGFRGASILLALVLIEYLDHAFERKNAIEPRRLSFDLA